MRIVCDQAENAIVIPRTCLFRDGNGGWNVMVVRHGVTSLQPVSVGILNDDEAKITAGLSESDHVVTRPSRDIVPDMRVTVMRE